MVPPHFSDARRILLVCAGFLGCVIPGAVGRAQDTPEHLFPSLGFVDTVIIIGNASTKEYVILNEMSIRPGTSITLPLLEYDRARIYSLGLFTSVDLSLDTLSERRSLLVLVNERWHYFPVPVIGFRDGDPKKVYYGAGFMHNNFQGRNQKLYTSLVLGYNPSAQISFREPLIERVTLMNFTMISLPALANGSLSSKA
ncbi:MAG: Surface antigen variable number repeat-containing protein [Bacteroidetes bacterium]|nr:Surface antigen variable number repeat-containing protein [Bacteroidota bacterium]